MSAALVYNHMAAMVTFKPFPSKRTERTSGKNKSDFFDDVTFGLKEPMHRSGTDNGATSLQPEPNMAAAASGGSKKIN